jgi:predicted ATP-grasp superfamily ATP-dependent carboligase
MSRSGDDRLAIVLGLSPTGLYAVRELARSGIPVLGVGRSGEPGMASRYLRSPGGRWEVGNQSELLQRLLAMPFPGAKPVLFPTNDTYIEFLFQNQEALSSRFTFAPAYHGLAQTLMDKRLLHQLCVEEGIPTPRVWSAGNLADLRNMGPDLPYPCILKPMLIHRAKVFLAGQKVLLATDPARFRQLVEAIPEDSGGWLVQEIITGPESNIVLFGGYFDRHAQPMQQFTGRKLRQYPAGFGSASLVISEWIPEIAESTVRLLTKAGFAGVCGSEFKRDPRDGQLKMIEINPRPTLWFQATHAAGKRIMEAAFRDLTGLPSLPEEHMRTSVVWRYGLKDLASALFYRYRGGQFVLAAPDVSSSRKRTARAWAVFDRSDPMPVVTEISRYFKRWWERS